MNAFCNFFVSDLVVDLVVVCVVRFGVGFADEFGWFGGLIWVGLLDWFGCVLCECWWLFLCSCTCWFLGCALWFGWVSGWVAASLRWWFVVVVCGGGLCSGWDCFGLLSYSRFWLVGVLLSWWIVGFVVVGFADVLLFGV